jgi:hypothetical protein
MFRAKNAKASQIPLFPPLSKGDEGGFFVFCQSPRVGGLARDRSEFRTEYSLAKHVLSNVEGAQRREGEIGIFWIGLIPKLSALAPLREKIRGTKA